MTSFQRALQRLAQRTNYERTRPDTLKAFGLEPMRRLWEAWGCPGESLPTLHIAGTKGKGSTAWYAGALVRATGLQVGVYTSPHLVSPCERLAVNGLPIAEDAFAALAQEACDLAAEVEKKFKLKPTWFDLVTAMALRHFQNSRVHVVVLETGLGGRLDSTNICTPRCTLITRIGLDHTAILGDTLSAIAMEKAGIIKHEVPVVTCSQDPDALRVIDKVAHLHEAPLHVLGRDFNLSLEPEGADLDTGIHYYTGLVKAAAGPHQWENAALAIKAVELLAGQIGMKFSEQDVRFALGETLIPGRMQPWDDLLLDGAHNPLSMAACVEGLRELDLRDLRLIFAMKSDKNISECLQCLRGFVGQVWCVPLEDGGVDPQELAVLAGEILQVPVAAVTSFSAALDAARAAGGEDPILVTGSLYLVGEALRVSGEKNHEAH